MLKVKLMSKIFQFRLFSLFRKRRVESELAAELRFHLEKQIEVNIAAGMSPTDARAAALRLFGGIEQIKEDCRAVHRLNLIENLLQDIRYGARGLMRTPLLVLVAAVSIGLGIGANITIFSLFHAVLLDGPTARKPEHLMHVVAGNSNQISYLNFTDLQQSELFDTLAAYKADPENLVNLRFGNETKAVYSQFVSANYFDLLGVQLILGRAFAANEARPEADPHLVILSYGCWLRRLGGDAAILGRVLNLNGHAYTVLGVLPKDFRSVIGYGVAPELYVALNRELMPYLETRAGNALNMIGRLPDGATRAQISAALRVVVRRLAKQYPDDNKNFEQVRLKAVSGLDRLNGNDDLPVLLFFTLLTIVVGLVLLIACANVAGLFLARGASRRREIAIRLAIGAGRGRVVRQLLTETLLLAVVGTALGLLFDWCAAALLVRIPLPLPVPIEFHLALDHRMLFYALALCALTTLVCGLVPALQSTRSSLTPALKQELAQFSHRRLTLRNVLVAGQVAVSLVLLVTSSLFLRSLLVIGHTDPGFDIDRTLTAELRLPPNRYTRSQGETFLEQAVDRLSQLPGIASAACANYLPLSFNDRNDVVRVDGDSEAQFNPAEQVVGHDYFSTMQVPVLRGREFSRRDREGAPHVAIINETLAHHHFAEQDPVGKRLIYGWGDHTEPIEIVGIVRDTKYLTLGEDQREILYLPYLQYGVLTGGSISLVARTQGDAPRRFLTAVKQSIRQADPTVALEVHIMRDILALAFWPTRFMTTMLGVMGALGLLLAMVGLHGVISYAVARRTNEIGIRMALGASRAQVLRMILADGLSLVAAGAAVGLLVSAAATGPLSALLAAGVRTLDPLIFAGVTLALALVATGSSLVAARRSMLIDPIIALRYD